MEDPFNLRRFLTAQEPLWIQVRQELAEGRKRSHWMWFVFPQLEGLGRSATAKYYGISGIGEAKAYLDHPILGPRLLESVQRVNAVTGKTAHQIFGSPDDLKFRSSLTLFSIVQPELTLFHDALRKYFDGVPDERTVVQLGGGA